MHLNGRQRAFLTIKAFETALYFFFGKKEIEPENDNFQLIRL